jgi:hypothetical protein
VVVEEDSLIELLSSSAVVVQQLLVSDVVVEAMLVQVLSLNDDVGGGALFGVFVTVITVDAGGLVTAIEDFQLLVLDDDDDDVDEKTLLLWAVVVVVVVRLLALAKIERWARLGAFGVFGGASGFDALFTVEDTCDCCLTTAVKADARITLAMVGVPPTTLTGWVVVVVVDFESVTACWRFSFDRVVIDPPVAADALPFTFDTTFAELLALDCFLGVVGTLFRMGVSGAVETTPPTAILATLLALPPLHTVVDLELANCWAFEALILHVEFGGAVLLVVDAPFVMVFQLS